MTQRWREFGLPDFRNVLAGPSATTRRTAGAEYQIEFPGTAISPEACAEAGS